MVFGNESQKKQLDNVIRLNNVEPESSRNHLLARAKQSVPKSEDNAVITVMLAAQRRMMGTMECRSNNVIRQGGFVVESQVGMMKKDKNQFDRFDRENQIGINANEDYEKAFVKNLQKQIEDVKTEAGRDIDGLVAMMNLMKAP